MVFRPGSASEFRTPPERLVQTEREASAASFAGRLGERKPRPARVTARASSSGTDEMRLAKHVEQAAQEAAATSCPHGEGSKKGP